MTKPRDLTRQRLERRHVAVIVPVLDEAANLDKLLDDLERMEGVRPDVCVADGGSTDDSVAVAHRRGARVVHAETGRGSQMNAGREAVDAPWLLFLHADSRLEDPTTLRRAVDALRLLTDRDGDAVAGHFGVRFDHRPSDHELAFRFLERKTHLNRPHTTSGDQGLLLAASYFDRLGGFDESLPFLEDQRLAEQIRRTGRWVTLPGELRTSSRRFYSEGFVPRYFTMAVIMAIWRAGVDEFFELAPDLYRTQSETGRLHLGPIFDALWETMQRIGVRRSIEAWLDVGRFARENSWQIAFFLDTVTEEEAYPFLSWWDEHLADVDHPLVDAIVAAAAFVAVMGIAPRLDDDS